MNRNTPATPAEAERIVATYRRVGSVNAVRAELGHSYDMVRRVLDVAGVSNHGRPPRIATTPDNDARILALRTAGLSPTAIGLAVFGQANGSRRVIRRLQQLGWQPPPPPAPPETPERDRYDDTPLPACHPLALDVLRAGGAWVGEGV